MKLSKLLATRHILQRQAHLAGLAHAYHALQRLAARVATAGLHGLVRLQPADPAAERYWPTLTALEGNQSVIEEQFSDDDIMEFAEAVVLAVEANDDELEFHLEELTERFVTPLRLALEQAGVAVDLDWAKPNLAAGNSE